MSRLARSYDSSVFNFLRNNHTVFGSGCTNLHSYQPCMRIFFSPLPHQHLLLVVFLIIAIMTGVRLSLIVVWMCTSTMISDFEHHFMFLLIGCISS